MKILSIQSHVVSGYVGNKCAVFPLQLLGHDVDPLNTVQVSNHSGYKNFKGHKFDAAHFNDILDALNANNLDEYQIILSGYLGTCQIVPELAKNISKLLNKSKDSIYILDPVLGDNGKLYLPLEMIDMYLKHLIPLASLITPNQFEFELLTNSTNINSVSEVIEKCKTLKVREIIITSIKLTSEEIKLEACLNTMRLFAYSELENKSWIIQFPSYSDHFTGTGDLFSSLVSAYKASSCFDSETGETIKSSMSLKDLCCSVIWVMQKVLLSTIEASYKIKKDKSLKDLELCIFKCQDQIKSLVNVSEKMLTESGIKVFESVIS
jgi:pyridoxine kinase